jgi:ribosomal protein S18 acetylase RimI-like enzyme
MEDQMTFAERWHSLPHGGCVAGTRTLSWMEREVLARPDCAYVGPDAMLVPLKAHEGLIDLYVAAKDAQALEAAIAREWPRIASNLDPGPMIVAKGTEGQHLAPLGFARIDELLYYLLDPLPPGEQHPSVRPAAPHELDALIALDRAAFPVAFQRSSREMSAHLLEVSVVRVASQGDHLLGFTILQPLGERYHLGAIGVHPNKQNRGWGKILLADALATARLAGATAVGLTTQASNLSSRALYERIGMAASPAGPVWARVGSA